MVEPEEYRRRAAAADALAAKAPTQDVREGFLQIAEEYRRLAGAIEGSRRSRMPPR